MNFLVPIIGVFAGSVWDIAHNQGHWCVAFARLFFRGLHMVGVA